MGWLACAVYSTIPAFWLMIHPFAERWRTRHVSGGRSPYVLLVPAWMAMWAIAALASWPWRHVLLYSSLWAWAPAALLFATGLYLYAKSGKGFSAKQLGGVPEIHGGDGEAATGDGWYPRARAASGVPGASVRDAGVEHRDWACRVLGADGIRDRDGRDDDSDGGCGVGEEVRRRVR